MPNEGLSVIWTQFTIHNSRVLSRDNELHFSALPRENGWH